MNVFQSVPIPRVGKSKFDLSYNHKFTANMGKLYPALCKPMVPGDTFKVGNQTIVRMQPLVSPALQDINVYFHYFFVPYRILNKNWEDFITGGEDGTYATPLPEWDTYKGNSENTARKAGSLWDKLGFPCARADGSYIKHTNALAVHPFNISVFPRLAYNRIWNEYYRDENLQAEVSDNNEELLHRAWQKDYFTSALTTTQKGIAPAVPVSLGGTGIPIQFVSLDSSAVPLSFSNQNLMWKQTYSSSFPDAPAQTTPSVVVGDDVEQVPAGLFMSNEAAKTVGMGFTINDIRLTSAIQRWMEVNNVCGSRIHEFLLGHYGTAPNDDRLQRPEYVGGCIQPVVISEVTQGDNNGITPLGTQAGKGLSASSNFITSYTAREHGIIMGLMSIMPARASYYGGIPREWIQRTRYDYLFPEFAHIGEQEIFDMELDLEDCAVASGVVKTDDNWFNSFGYQGRYNEYRASQDMMDYNMAYKYDYWHLGRKFANKPTLNGDFIKCDPDKRIFAYTGEEGEDFDEFVIDCQNVITAFRPLPTFATPASLL